MLKRIGYGIVGALFGSFCAYMAMSMLGRICWSAVIIAFIGGFILSFWGGRHAVEYILGIEDYIP